MAGKFTPNGLARFRIFSAIEALRRQGKIATVKRISKIVGYDVGTLVGMYTTHYGMLSKKLIDWRKVKKAGIRDEGMLGCSFHFKINSKGIRDFERLKARFGDVRV